MQVGKRDEIDIDFLERWKKAFNFALGNEHSIPHLLPYYYSKIKSK